MAQQTAVSRASCLPREPSAPGTAPNLAPRRAVPVGHMGGVVPFSSRPRRQPAGGAERAWRATASAHVSLSSGLRWSGCIGIITTTRPGHVGVENRSACNAPANSTRTLSAARGKAVRQSRR
jgi:hypothetical protein